MTKIYHPPHLFHKVPYTTDLNVFLTSNDVSCRWHAVLKYCKLPNDVKSQISFNCHVWPRVPSYPALSYTLARGRFTKRISEIECYIGTILITTTKDVISELWIAQIFARKENPQKVSYPGTIFPFFCHKCPQVSRK